MVIVSDSSPLIALASIGKLDLLERLCGRVFIPPAVFREIVSEGAGRPGADEVRQASWIRTVASQDKASEQAIRELRRDHPGLGAGEAEAIVLAVELGAEWVLLDETLARRVARDRDLEPIGAIGILVAFKERGWLTDLTAEVDLLVDRGFRVSRRLLESIRRRYGG